MADILQWSKGFLFEIHQTHFLIEKRLAERLAAAQRITFSQFLVLMALSCCNNASQSDIAGYLFLTEATVSRHIRTLIANGYVTKKKNPESKREFVLSITAKGGAEMQKTQSVIDKEITEIISPLSAANRDELSKATSSLLSSLQKNSIH
jgi:MarR family 2-MHQ and catechol resistance regulon transcriptional repressor